MLSEDPNVQQSTVAQLQRDLKLFHTLEQSVADGTAPKYLLDRHAFHLKPVVQLVEIMRSTNWRITPEVSAWLRNFHARIMGSQVCEDGLKDCRQVEHDNQNRKANTKGLFHKMVCGNTLTERHHYSEPKASVSQYVRGAHLPDEAFHSSAKTATKDFSSVKGPSASTIWFSPSAERTSLPYADLDLLDLSYDEGADTFRPMSTAWMNTIIGGKGMVIRKKRTQRWLFPLGGYSDSVCYCVPAEVEMCPRSPVKQWFLLPTSTCALVPIVVGDFEDWEAIPFLWLSPLGQERAMKTGRNNRKRKFFSVVAARAMCDPKISDGAALSVLKVAAHFAFWSQPAIVLKKLARHLEVKEACAPPALPTHQLPIRGQREMRSRHPCPENRRGGPGTPCLAPNDRPPAPDPSALLLGPSGPQWGAPAPQAACTDFGSYARCCALRCRS